MLIYLKYDVSFCNSVVFKRGEDEGFMCLSIQLSLSSKLFQKHDETLSFEAVCKHKVTEFEGNSSVGFSTTLLLFIQIN